VSSPERKSFGEKAIELSKIADTYMIAVGAGIFVLVNSALGIAIIFGSVLTMIPADMVDKWLKKRKAKRQ
jgi:hypothetical protein